MINVTNIFESNFLENISPSNIYIYIYFQIREIVCRFVERKLLSNRSQSRWKIFSKLFTPRIYTFSKYILRFLLRYFLVEENKSFLASSVGVSIPLLRFLSLRKKGIKFRMNLQVGGRSNVLRLLTFREIRDGISYNDEGRGLELLAEDFFLF